MTSASKEQGWNVPQGHIDRSKSNPLNYDLQNWHQVKRQKQENRVFHRKPKELDKLRFTQPQQRKALQASIDNLSEQYAKDRQSLCRNVLAQAEKTQVRHIQSLLQSQGHQLGF